MISILLCCGYDGKPRKIIEERAQLLRDLAEIATDLQSKEGYQPQYLRIREFLLYALPKPTYTMGQRGAIWKLGSGEELATNVPNNYQLVLPNDGFGWQFYPTTITRLAALDGLAIYVHHGDLSSEQRREILAFARRFVEENDSIKLEAQKVLQKLEQADAEATAPGVNF